MKIAVIGGRLQGVEICYLAKKTGFETLVIDKSAQVPARGLCTNFIEFYFTAEEHWPDLPEEWCNLELIFPALEDSATLNLLSEWANYLNIPLVFDLHAYTISQSKTVSNTLFQELQLPLPKAFPNCSFPVIVKPDQASGSEGVVKIHKEVELTSLQTASAEKLLIQEYLEGPSYSLEVIGSAGQYSVLQTTDLYMDADFDCCRVSAPTKLSIDLERKLREMITAIAEKLALKGIMDLEVVLYNDRVYVLEIDARFPSQTPITVYLSTGINMVAMLTDLFLAPEKRPTLPSYSPRHALLEHIRVAHGEMEICGEHIISNCGQLYLTTDFFGADEALTTYDPDQSQWVATLMFTGDNEDLLEKKRSLCHQQISPAASSTNIS